MWGGGGSVRPRIAGFLPTPADTEVPRGGVLCQRHVHGEVVFSGGADGRFLKPGLCG